MDNGTSFVPLIGFLTNSMVTTLTVTQNIIKGNTYRFRYRAMNQYGWGPYSDVAYITAA